MKKLRFREVMQGLYTIAFPENAVCVACGALRVQDTRFSLCEQCAAALERFEPPYLRVKGEPPLVEVFAAYPYANVPARLVRALKYRNVLGAADALAFGMAQALPARELDALAPIPLYRLRERTRGFNQAQALAERLSALCGLPVLDALRRSRDTKTQTHMDAAMRARNVEGAFEATMDVAGKKLLLIDDVYTTGSTARACAIALRHGGASSVRLLTAAAAVKRVEEGSDAGA